MVPKRSVVRSPAKDPGTFRASGRVLVVQLVPGQSVFRPDHACAPGRPPPPLSRMPREPRAPAPQPGTAVLPEQIEVSEVSGHPSRRAETLRARGSQRAERGSGPAEPVSSPGRQLSRPPRAAWRPRTGRRTPRRPGARDAEISMTSALGAGAGGVGVEPGGSGGRCRHRLSGAGRLSASNFPSFGVGLGGLPGAGPCSPAA